MRNQYVQGSYTPQSNWGSGSRRPGQARILRSRHLLTYGNRGLVPPPRGWHASRERISKRGWGLASLPSRHISPDHTHSEKRQTGNTGCLLLFSSSWPGPRTSRFPLSPWLVRPGWPARSSRPE